jgi:hypothetical protein
MSEKSTLLHSVLLANSITELPSNEEIEEMTETQILKLHDLLQKAIDDFRDQSRTEVVRLLQTIDSFKNPFQTQPLTLAKLNVRNRSPKIKQKKGYRIRANRKRNTFKMKSIVTQASLEFIDNDRRVYDIEREISGIARRCKQLQFGSIEMIESY